MRKYSAILIIISLLVSAFDIIDTSDIMLGNQAAFTSTNDLDQDHIDDLDIDGVISISSSNILVYNLVTVSPYVFVSSVEKEVFSIINQAVPEDYIYKSKKPPKA